MWLFFLVHLKGLLRGFSNPYYSQWGEDIVLRGLFGKQHHGFYVDVGAYHPYHYSNTYLLYQRGWHGINVDPNPWSMWLFTFHRPRDRNVQAGIGSHESTRAYYMFNHQSCNTFSPEQRDLMLKRKFMKQIGEKQIRIAPLQNIVDEHSHGHSIDFLNVDVEGMSLEVLETLDWGKNSPRVICVEDDGGDAIHIYLTERRYQLRTRVGLSSIYEHI